MITATRNWKKWIGLTALVVVGSFCGCKDSEYAQRKEAVSVAQFYGPASQPHTASVRWQQIDSALMQSVCSHSSLRELSIFTATRDGTPIFPQVAKLPKLETLNIVEVPLNDAELAALSEAKELVSLELSRTGISGAGLQHIANLPIKRLVVRDKQLSVEGLKAIASMTELEELEICVPGIHLADLPTLSSNSKLKSVTITDGHFSYREFGGLKFLLGANNLTHLHLSGVNLNDRSLKTIGTLRNLRSLTIEESVISEEGIEHLASLEQLQTLELPTFQSPQSPIRLVECIEDTPLPHPVRG